MPIWPIAPFPQKMLQHGYSDELGEGTIRSDMEVGPAKTRKRSDRSPDTFRGSLYLTTTQTDDLDDFYKSTLSWGSLSFEWTHPRLGTTGDFRFIKQPRYSIYGVGYMAAIEVEQLST